ncbi:MAG: FecR family protein [Acidobacteriota bacterium]|nr:FecR family protein [Acidobacteriota bacterium]
MKINLSHISAVCLAVMALAFSTSAQNETIAAAAGDKFVISAKAGGVNFVEGTVSVVRTYGKSGYLLKGDRLQIGDRVSTGTDGKAEILLNPGSYLRLGGNSEFEFKTTSLDDLQLRLNAGSAMLEVFADDEFAVNILTPKTKFNLVDSGIYRVDVSNSGDGKIAVWKGRATIGDLPEAVVKGGREGSLAGSGAAIAKFDRDEKDGLELWSKARAKELAKISNKLKSDNLRPSLMNSYIERRWNMYNSFGLWVYDPFWRVNCFLPFGQSWYSPYGYGFGQSIWNYNLPVRFYQPMYTKRDTNGNSRISEVPPFIKMQPDRGRGRVGSDPVSPSQPSPTFSPMISMPSKSAPSSNKRSPGN